MKNRSINCVIIVCIVVMLLFTLLGTQCLAQDIENNAALDENVETTLEKANALLDSFSVQKLIEFFINEIKSSFVKYGKGFVMLIALTVFFGIVNTLIENKTVCFAGELVLCTSGFSILTAMCDNLIEVMNSIENLMLSMLPVMTTLYTASSAPVTGAASYASTVVILNICSAAFTQILLPAVKYTTLLSTVAIVSYGYNFQGFSKLVKNTISRIFGLVLCIMSASVYFQSVITVSKDGIASRAVRYAAANIIPVIGGVVSESARTLSESLRLVRSVSGAAGILSIIGIVASPLIAIGVAKLFFKLCACAAAATGGTRIAAYYDEVGETLNMLLGACIGVCLVLVLILGIFAKTAIAV